MYAKWLQGTGTPYTIEHYQQNLKNNEYTFYESEKRFGTTDTKTSSTAKAYEGFTAKGFEEKTILADGTTVVEIYYDRKSYTVSFSDDGEISESQTLRYEQTAAEPISPTKTGYTFDGWYTSSDEGTTLQSKHNFDAPITSDITLYAKWLANTYSVTFDKNAQNATETMLTQNFTYDKEATLLSNVFSNPGYRFSVWNTKADGSGEVYNNNQSVKNLTSENGKNITLYAQWTLEGNYLITYNLDEGTNNPNNPLEYNVESATIVLQAPTKEGYIFEGWENEFGTVITEITKGSTGDIILTAQWTPRTDIRYTVEYYKQNVEDENYALSDTENKEGTTATKTSSTVKTYEGFTAKEFEEQTILADGSTVVKIYYDRNTYTVSFDNKDGTPASYESIRYENLATEPTSPTKVGYVFDGWYTSSDEGTTLETEYDFTTPITKDVKLYAKWLQGTNTRYTVKHYKQNVDEEGYTFYEADYKTGTTDTETSSTAKAYEGFTAKGFEEQTILPDGTTVVEIYYDRNIYTVSFSDDGEISESQTLRYEQTATEPTSPTKTGYTFDGWYTSSDNGTTLQRKHNFDAPITSDITLYAKWNTVDYTIIYEFNGGEAVDNPTSYNIETETITLAEPTKTGYTFDGWYTDVSLTIKKIEITKGSTGDIKLYAKWIANKSGITITLPESNDPEINLQQAMNGEKVTFTANDGFTSYTWYIDGEKRVDVAGKTFELDTSSMVAANYSVMVIVTDSAQNYYSATAYLELKK